MKLINFKPIQKTQLLFRYYKLNISKVNILSKDVDSKIIKPLLNNKNKYFFSLYRNNNLIIKEFSKKNKKLKNNNKEKNEEKEEPEINIDVNQIKETFNKYIDDTKNEMDKINFGKINLNEIKDTQISIKLKKEPLSNYGQIILKGNLICHINIFEDIYLNKIFKNLQSILKNYEVGLENDIIKISIGSQNVKEKKNEFLKNFKIVCDDKKSYLKTIRTNELDKIKKISNKIEKNLKNKIQNQVNDCYEKGKLEIDKIYKNKEKQIN